MSSILLRKIIDMTKIPKSRVELHLHLEGAVRLSTIWELCQNKDIKLTANGTYDELLDNYIMKRPAKLIDCLNLISDYSRVYHGDSKALERIAYEISEDQSKQHVFYFELRLSPQLSSNTIQINDQLLVVSELDPNACSPKQVIKSVLNGLKRGEKEFGIKSSLILSCITVHPEWSEEVLQLAQEFKDRGVVGIDIAGPESESPMTAHSFGRKDVQTFVKAKELGIHRTVHAGEAGPGSNVAFAIDHMCAERIGHGYSGVHDKHVYQKCIEANIHFECCALSSYYTSWDREPHRKHAIVVLAEDNGNYSINKDDPTVFNCTLDSEYKYLQKLGFTELHIIRANINAMKASFLPEKQKTELLRELLGIYGLN